MKVIKNYKVSGKKYEEFNYGTIREDVDVFSELPLCLLDFGDLQKEKIIYYNENLPMPIALSEEEIEKVLLGTRRFFFSKKGKDGVKEVSEKDAEFVYRLPIDTPVKKLVFINGQLGIIEEQEQEEEQEERQEKGDKK